MAEEQIDEIIDEESFSTYSWTIKFPDIAIKKLDKSTFFNFGTGIPVQLREFFGIENLQYGEKKSVELLYENNRYKAYFKVTKTKKTTL